MKDSIRDEFKQRAIDYVNDGILTEENKDEWHFYLFNEDYYIIGYRRAENWLTLHDISPFEAIGIVKDYQEENFGETDLDYSSSESVVNMLAYILGEEWMQEDGEEFIQLWINK